MSENTLNFFCTLFRSAPLFSEHSKLRILPLLLTPIFKPNYKRFQNNPQRKIRKTNLRQLSVQGSLSSLFLYKKTDPLLLKRCRSLFFVYGNNFQEAPVFTLNLQINFLLGRGLIGASFLFNQYKERIISVKRAVILLDAAFAARITSSPSFTKSSSK